MKVMKKGFTLAEVLITLAIIGVVAALTIPTVVTNYKAKALETQNKKAMSVITNGFRLLMANDSVTSLHDTKIVLCSRSDKACFADEIKRAFNVVADNISENSAFNTEYQYKVSQLWKDEQMFDYVFITSDGMIFGMRLMEARSDHSQDISITADLNGVKNPNKSGQDLRRYMLYNTGKLKDNTSDLICNYNNPSACTQEQCGEIMNSNWNSETGECEIVPPRPPRPDRP